MEKDEQTTLDLLKRTCIILFFLFAVILLTGGIMYGLYRVVLLDRRLYALLYCAAAAGLFLFCLLRLIRSGRLTRVILNIVRVFVHLMLALFILSALMLYGSLILRRPLIAASAAPPIVFLTAFLFPRWKLYAIIKERMSVFRKDRY